MAKALAPSIVYIDEIEKVVVEDKKRIKAWKAEDRCRPPTSDGFAGATVCPEFWQMPARRADTRTRTRPSSSKNSYLRA